MLAYEFESLVKDGTIQVPAEYAEKISNTNPVKVILMPSRQDSSDKTRFFPDLGLSTKGYRFNREEANAR
jgi:hypothetical protein